MDVVYGVQWIEVDFGQRDEGYKLFRDEQECIKSTKESSRNGPYEGGSGYMGPVRPLSYVEIPVTSLEKELRRKFKGNSVVWTDRRWKPKFTGKRKYIS